MSVVQLIFIWSMSFFIYFYKSYTSGMQTATSWSCSVWRVSTFDKGGTCFLRNWLELSTALRTFLIASLRFDASNVTSSPKLKCNGYIGSFHKRNTYLRLWSAHTFHPTWLPFSQALTLPSERYHRSFCYARTFFSDVCTIFLQRRAYQALPSSLLLP